MSTAPTDSTVGTSILGRYRVVRKLARGGMGAVYLARTEGAEGFARPVVIKRVLATLMGDDEVAQMFVREARILSELQHPNIVPVLDFGQDSDGAYVMVLDYVNGYHLGQWGRYCRKASGGIPADMALYIMGRVLDALHYAHTLTRSDGKTVQIIHRDVTPSNVLLDLQGQVKLLDFGIARVSGDETVMVTETPQVKGKLPYLALEIFQGKDPSAASDVYSAGVVLYELLTGNNPFMGRETADIFHKVLTENLPSVHSVRDDVPEDIDEVLGRAVNRDPTARYQTAAEFAEALAGLRDRTDGAIAEDLRKQVQQDFQGGMPKALNLEPLSLRDAAWRGTIESRTSDYSRRNSSDPGPGATAGVPLEQIDVPTVQADIPLELLQQADGAADARVTVPPPGRERRSRATLNTPSPDGSALAPPPIPSAIGAGELDSSVFDRVTAPPANELPGQLEEFGDDTALTAPPPMAEGQRAGGAAAAAVDTPARGGATWAVAIAAVALSAASLWFSLSSVDSGGEKEIVVIERQSASSGAAPSPKNPVPPDAHAPAPVPVPGEQPPPEPPPSPQEAEPKTEPIAKVPKAAPKPPNPRTLTRRFGRKQGRIEACFAKHAKTLEGRPKVAVHFVITEAGRVKEAKLDPVAMGSTPLGKCLLGVAKGTYFGAQQREFAFRIPITARVVAPTDG